MSKNKDKTDGRQLNIFAFLKPDVTPAPGTMNISLRLRQSISAGIKESGKDRIEVCLEIYKLTGIEVSKSTLDGWSAESRCISSDCIDPNGNKRWGIPAEILAAFCYVTNYWEPLHIVVEAGQHKALKGKDVVRARVGLLKEEIAKKTKEMKDMEKALVDDEYIKVKGE